TETKLEAAGAAFLDVDDYVDLVVSVPYFRRFDVHVFEKSGALQSDFRTVERGLRVPTALELAHFTAHDFVGGLGIALEQDAPDAHARAGLDEQVDRDGAFFAI